MRISIKVALDHTLLSNCHFLFSVVAVQFRFLFCQHGCGMLWPLHAFAIVASVESESMSHDSAPRHRSMLLWEKMKKKSSWTKHSCRCIRIRRSPPLESAQKFRKNSWCRLVQYVSTCKYVNGISCLKHFVTCQERRIH